MSGNDPQTPLGSISPAIGKLLRERLQMQGTSGNVPQNNFVFGQPNTLQGGNKFQNQFQAMVNQGVQSYPYVSPYRRAITQQNAVTPQFTSKDPRFEPLFLMANRLLDRKFRR